MRCNKSKDIAPLVAIALKEIKHQVKKPFVLQVLQEIKHQPLFEQKLLMLELRFLKL